FKKEALPTVKEQQTVAERSDKSNLEVFRVKQALSECHERLALLDSLQRLRTARLSQARQRGGLFPDAFDQAFNAQLNEIRSVLRTQLTKLTVVETQQVCGDIIFCVPWRWARFYHQADFDFADFLRIR
ncbi:hypothetical protein FBUS_08918, partial [Fasciolopsis buskii]